MMVRPVVVDDHPMVCAGARSELEHFGTDLVIAGEAADVEGAVVICHEFKPDVTLLDMHLSGGRGGGGVEVSAYCQDIEGLCFLAPSVSGSLEGVVQVIRSDAHGYVMKSISTPGLVEAIRRVTPGDVAFSPRLAGLVLDALDAGQVATGDNEFDLLFAREQEVMRLIARDYTYKEVDNELFISVETVETHVLMVLRKLQLSNRNELTR